MVGDLGCGGVGNRCGLLPHIYIMCLADGMGGCSEWDAGHVLILGIPRL